MQHLHGVARRVRVEHADAVVLRERAPLLGDAGDGVGVLLEAVRAEPLPRHRARHQPQRDDLWGERGRNKTKNEETNVLFIVHIYLYIVSCTYLDICIYKYGCTSYMLYIMACMLYVLYTVHVYSIVYMYNMARNMKITNIYRH